jgi:hypothetical protein
VYGYAVSIFFAEVGLHGFEYSGVNGCGCGVVHVNVHAVTLREITPLYLFKFSFAKTFSTLRGVFPFTSGVHSLS